MSIMFGCPSCLCQTTIHNSFTSDGRKGIGACDVCGEPYEYEISVSAKPMANIIHYGISAVTSMEITGKKTGVKGPLCMNGSAHVKLTSDPRQVTCERCKTATTYMGVPWRSPLLELAERSTTPTQAQ